MNPCYFFLDNESLGVALMFSYYICTGGYNVRKTAFSTSKPKGWNLYSAPITTNWSRGGAETIESTIQMFTEHDDGPKTYTMDCVIDFTKKEVTIDAEDWINEFYFHF